MRRKAFGLANDTWCLLILDGCLVHNEEDMRELNKHFIDYHFLVSHSSHLSQPLDRGIFALFKRVFKNTQCNNMQNKVGRWLIRGLIALYQVCSPAHIRSSFWRARFEMNYIDGIPTINIYVQTWLTQQNSLNTNIKKESFIYELLKKKKRTRIVMKRETKKIILFLYFIAIPKKQNEKKSETGFCSETGFSS
jgi:hypothetical protein